jgi:hypothetical protein
VTEVPLPDAAGIPLLSHAGPDDVVAWRGSEAVSRQRFLGHVARVAAGLPPGRHFVNACADRYRFAVGFAAGLLSGRVSLLPSTLGEAVLRQLAEFAPDVFVLGDGEALPGGLPAHPFDDALPPAGAALIEPPVIAADQLVAWVFTSGSTGVPVPHRKTWGKLVRDVRIEARQVGLPVPSASPRACSARWRPPASWPPWAICSRRAGARGPWGGSTWASASPPSAASRSSPRSRAPSAGAGHLR